MFQKRIDTIREELSKIEQEVDNMYLTSQERSKPAQHGKPWSGFEKGILKEELNVLADKLARQFGRTNISILLHIHTYISGGMKDA